MMKRILLYSAVGLIIGVLPFPAVPIRKMRRPRREPWKKWPIKGQKRLRKWFETLLKRLVRCKRNWMTGFGILMRTIISCNYVLRKYRLNSAWRKINISPDFLLIYPLMGDLFQKWMINKPFSRDERYILSGFLPGPLTFEPSNSNPLFPKAEHLKRFSSW